jgi:hypothetical protein
MYVTIGKRGHTIGIERLEELRPHRIDDRGVGEIKLVKLS